MTWLQICLMFLENFAINCMKFHKNFYNSNFNLRVEFLWLKPKDCAIFLIDAHSFERTKYIKKIFLIDFSFLKRFSSKCRKYEKSDSITVKGITEI